MSEDAQDQVKLEVRYVDVKKKAWLTINSIDKLDELKTLLDEFYFQIGSNHRTRDVIVNVSGVDLGEDKEEDFWKTVYFPQLLKMIATLITCLGPWLRITICIYMSDMLKCSIYLSVIV